MIVVQKSIQNFDISLEEDLEDFVTKIKFKWSTIFKIPNLVFQKFENLQVFDGSSAGLHNITMLSFNGAGNLKTILLHNNHLSAINNNCFIHSKNLKYLDLSNNKITKIQAHAFNSLNNLEVLSLSNNNIKTLDSEILSHLTNLQWIWLDRNHFSIISSTLFPRTNVKLHGIYLNSNEIVKISPLAFNNLPKLRFLMLSGNPCINRNFKNHVIQENASIKVEMKTCLKEYQEDEKLMQQDAKYNMTKTVKRLESFIMTCANETRQIEKNIDEALKTMNYFKNVSSQIRV